MTYQKSYLCHHLHLPVSGSQQRPLSWRLREFMYVDMILRSCHLLPLYESEMLSSKATHVNSLDVFRAYYVNKFELAWEG